MRTQSKEKVFQKLLHGDKRKLKRVIVKQPLLTSTQIFEKAKIEGVNKNKVYRILWELRSEKEFPRQPCLTEASILKRQN